MAKKVMVIDFMFFARKKISLQDRKLWILH